MSWAKIIFVVLIACSGWVYALWVNDDWHKVANAISEKWYKHCVELIEDNYRREKILLEQIDKLKAVIKPEGLETIVENEYSKLIPPSYSMRQRLLFLLSSRLLYSSTDFQFYNLRKKVL